MGGRISIGKALFVGAGESELFGTKPPLDRGQGVC
jgi:hypothetical protein